MARARIWQTELDGTSLTVRMDGLEYSGNRGMRFRLYVVGNPYYISEADSSNNGGEANVIFNVSSVSPGWTEFIVKRYMLESGREFQVGDSFYKNIGGGNTPQPYPKPQTQPMTKCRIDSIEIATDTAVTVKVTVDGYGDVFMRSVTLDQVGFDRDLANVKIYENDYDLQEKGYKTFEMSYRLEGYFRQVFSMYGERGLPLGTVEVRFTDSRFEQSIPFLCVGEYFYRLYNGTFETSIKPITAGYSVAVTSLSTVKDDWQLLINTFYYLSSTTEGALKMGSRADYIPRSGDVLTADMYNGLIDIASSCLDQIKYKYAAGGDLNPDLPNKVHSGQIIPKDFINVLGNAANKMVAFVKKESNSRVIGEWRYRS